MPTRRLEWTDTVDVSGFEEPDNVGAEDGSRAVGGTAGSSIVIKVHRAPSDYRVTNSGNGVRLSVRARVPDDASRQKQIRLTLLRAADGAPVDDSGGAAIVYTTPDLTQADRLYSSSSFVLEDNYGSSRVDSWVLRLDVLEGPGDPDQATVEVEYLAVTQLEYDGVLTFDEIAISLSGGGSRGNGYHLGVLWTLNHLKTAAGNASDATSLLDNVRIISSASGGSLIATTWALSRGTQTFANYFNDIATGFHLSDLIENTLNNLRTSPPLLQRPSQRYDLITAIADAFDHNFYNGATMADLPDPADLQVVFNATDFNNSLGFRFQNFPPIGSEITNIPIVDADYIRIADLMAASCAAPLGFEPIMFPKDFYWDAAGQNAYAAIRQVISVAEGAEAIPLMDGGIYDDQGIDAVVRAVASPAGLPPAVDQRYLPEALAAWLHQALETNPNAVDLDLYIVSDVTSPRDPVYAGGYTPPPPPYEVPPAPSFGWFTILGTAVAWWLLVALGLLTMFAVLYSWITNGFSSGVMLLVEIAALIGSALGLVALGYLGRAAIRLKDGVQRVLDTEGLGSGPGTAWGEIRRLKVRMITWMLRLRGGSTTVAPTILISRARQLGYQLLYSSNLFRSRVLANPIYQMLENTVTLVPPPSQPMRDIATAAAAQPVAFWYDRTRDVYDNHVDLDVLITCGQMTTCYNILRFIEKKETDGYALSPEVQQVKARGIQLWQDFQNDPWAHAFNFPVQPAPVNPTSYFWLIMLLVIIVVIILVIVL